MSHRSAAVSSKVIEFSLRGREFQVSDLERDLTDPPSRQTMYRVLDQLREDDWIIQRGNGWVPGVKAQMLGTSGDLEGGGRGGFSIDVDDLL